MPHSVLRPYGSLFIGIFFIALGVASMCSGEALGRFGSVVYRAEKPNQFWQLVAMEYIGGAFCIGYFLYKVYWLSN
jgi:hypothetical protein